MARGRGREGVGLRDQARHRGLRAGGLRRRLPRARRHLFRHPDLAVRPSGPVDGLGRLLLHPLRQQHRAHLELSAALSRARLDRGGPARHALVRALRHGALAARADRHLPGDHPRRAVRAAAAARTRQRLAPSLDHHALDAGRQRRRRRRSRADLRRGRDGGRRALLPRRSHAARSPRRRRARGRRPGHGRRHARLDLRRAVRRSARRRRHRASRHSLEGRGRRRGHRHRAHRPRRGRGRLSPQPGA